MKVKSEVMTLDNWQTSGDYFDFHGQKSFITYQAKVHHYCSFTDIQQRVSIGVKFGHN